MKRLINNGYDVVEEMTEGYIRVNSEYVHIHPDDNRVVISNMMSEEPRVRIIFGGGTGHEPLFMGYVGRNGADAAVLGNVNTSPSPEPILNAAKATDNGKGCLYIFGNYSGDILNFDMGIELTREEGIDADYVAIKDDIASSDNYNQRRGVAGDVMVFKVAAAAAAKGLSLKEVKEIAEKANRNTFSMGVALSPATLPVTGKPTFHIEPGNMEIGMGLHGETGIERKPLASANKVVDEIIEHIFERTDLDKGDEVCVLVNGLGGLPLMDQYICFNRVSQVLEGNGLSIKKAMVGNYATSMDMVGMSITLMRVSAELSEYFEYEIDTPYLKTNSDENSCRKSREE